MARFPTNSPERIVNLWVDQQQQGCWVWKGAVLANGYGKVTVDYKTKLVHRFLYEAMVGPIPFRYQIDHLCKNRLCVNPAHLEAVPARVNNARSTSPSSQNAAKTHCKHGHEFTPENIYVPAKRPNRRYCRACLKGRNGHR
jgi:hypothetical protein